MKRTYIFLALCLVGTNTMALEEMAGRITYVEPTYLPALIQFTLDTGSASCPAGKYLKWQKSDQMNNRAVYATLLLAIATGKRIRIYVNDGDTTCSGQYLHLLPD